MFRNHFPRVLKPIDPVPAVCKPSRYLSGDQLLGQLDRVVLVALAFLVPDLEQQLYKVVPAHRVRATEVDGLLHYAHEEPLHLGRERAQVQRFKQPREEHADQFGQRQGRGRVEHRASHPPELRLRVSQRVALEAERARADHVRRELGRQVAHFEFRLAGPNGRLRSNEILIHHRVPHSRCSAMISMRIISVRDRINGETKKRKKS